MSTVKSAGHDSTQFPRARLPVPSARLCHVPGFAGNWAITWSSCSSSSVSCSVVNTARTPSVVSRTVSPVCSHELIEAEFLGNRSWGAEGLVQRLGELPRKVAALARAESVGQRPQCRPGEIRRFFAGQGRALRHGPSEFFGLHVGPPLCWRRMGVPSPSPTMRPITDSAAALDSQLLPVVTRRTVG